jgi:hypothetical protein
MNVAKRTESKERRRTQHEKRAVTARGVSRREYAELVLRLGSAELQVQRNRAELELHASRIAQLHEILDHLMQAAEAAAAAKDLPLPGPPARTVES